RHAIHLCGPRDRDDLRPDRRDRRRVRRRAVRARRADAEHELQHGHRRAILSAADPVGARSAAQHHRQPGAQQRAVLGPVAEARRRRFEEKGRPHMTCAIRSLAVAALTAAAIATPAAAQTMVKVAWCARTVSSAAAPFAIATKLGWYAQAGIKVELAPLPGSTDCVKLVATGDLQYGLPSIEPVAIIRPQGVKIKNFYTAYQGNIYGIDVPVDSPIKRFTDLKGKRIGVTSMASAGVIIARALAEEHGWNADKDISIVAVGEAAQTAALLRSGQVDALSQFDTQYALTENAGVKLRALDEDNARIARFPSNGFIPLEERPPPQRAPA